MDLYIFHGIVALLVFCVIMAICIKWSMIIYNTLWSRRHVIGINDVNENSSQPKVSIIVPARNEKGEIARCLDTLLKQDYHDYEVIAVDDGSNDGTYDIMKSFKDRGILSMQTEKPDGWLGKSWACSEAAKRASGELLLFTDADTEHKPDSLSKAVSHMTAHGLDCLSLTPQLKMDSVWARAVLPLITSFKLVKPCGIIQYTEAQANDPRCRMGGFNGSYLLIKTDAYQKIGGFARVRNELFEDWALGLIARENMLKTRIADGRKLVSAAWARDRRSLNEILRRMTIQMHGRRKITNIKDFFLLAVLMFAPYIAAAASSLALILHTEVSTVMVTAGAAASVFFHMAAYAIHAKGLGLSRRSVFLAPLGGFIAATGYLKGITAESTTWRGRRITTKDIADENIMLNNHVKAYKRFLAWWKEWIYPKYGEVPPPFHRRSWLVWGLIFGIVFIITYYLHVYDQRFELKNAADILIINVEVLVTVLSVTLGATLLGIQFRAQSYSMLFLMKQINNLVVYLFVGIFVSQVIINLGFIIWIPEKDLDVYIPFVFLGTVFSMFYLVGYIYHMIHKLHPHEIMNEVGRDINKIVLEIGKCKKRNDNSYTSPFTTVNLDNWNAIMLKEKSHRSEYEKFDVWKEIMLRTVKNDNVTLFKKGLEKIFEIYDKIMKLILDVHAVEINKLNQDVKYEINFANFGVIRHKNYHKWEKEVRQLTLTLHFFVEYVNDIMISSIENNRDLCVLTFMRIFTRRDESYLRKYGWHFGPGLMFDVWYDVMRRCIIEEKDDLIRQGIGHLEKRLKLQLSECKETCEDTIVRGVFHHVLSSLVPLAMDKNSIYLNAYLDIVEIYQIPNMHELHECETKSCLHPISPWIVPVENRPQLFELVKNGMHHPDGCSYIIDSAYGKRDLSLFSSGIDALFDSLIGTKYYPVKVIRYPNPPERIPTNITFENISEEDIRFRWLYEALLDITENIEESEFIYEIVSKLEELKSNSHIDQIWLNFVSRIITLKNPGLNNIRSDLKNILQIINKPSLQTDYVELREKCQNILQEIPSSKNEYVSLYHLERIGIDFLCENNK
ncbi:glycosyltransferase involved in cell wall biogenesis [Cenarchaeum symbiosum A]|uniref:Glycosyltransferase involved in cell wall biogenesis n=1 Tax=Cenarchaeum symbiosum (strain A) TaxID=414004 RepID=A0RTT5_CENSY|nr:glycosyltransferase involved in cell wall biogenesis [Cenarchaeum symbiosum A]